MQNYFLTICPTSKSDAGRDAARNIRAVCIEKKGEKKTRAHAGRLHRGHSLNGSTILGHSSKRHNASSMTRNAWFWWNQVRRESRIKCVQTWWNHLLWIMCVLILVYNFSCNVNYIKIPSKLYNVYVIMRNSNYKVIMKYRKMEDKPLFYIYLTINDIIIVM